VSAPCNCIAEFDAKLAEQTARPMIVTDQIESGRGKKKACGVFATFCPFCGVKLGASA
jgi:hypothetical protein